MKTYKRFTAFILALVMCMSLAATAFAADNDTGDNSDVIWNFTGADEDLNQLDEELALVTSFKDVKTTAWYYSDVTECAKLGIVSGFEDGTFRPEDNVTGVQLIVMLTRTFYNSKVEAAEKTKPAGSSWYWANTYVASQVKMTLGLTVTEKAMNRNDMAMTLCNVIDAEGKLSLVSSAQLATAKAAIKDYSSLPTNRNVAVAYCYALGILTGMSDGTFSGTQNMTRAQACTVIMRMLKLINNYNPGDADNNVYDDGTAQKVLANGKPITTANVLEILNQIKAKYPNGSTWGATTAYSSIAGQDMQALNNKFISAGGSSYGSSSLRVACGGFAAMVSETIFGKTGFPFRQVTNTKDVRPGDVVIQLDANGKLTHYGIVSTNPVQMSNGNWQFAMCSGNVNGKISWLDQTDSMITSQKLVFTRYPD